jgi:hypothetical protein
MSWGAVVIVTAKGAEDEAVLVDDISEEMEKRRKETTR